MRLGQVGGINVDMENHATAGEADNGIRVGCCVIEEALTGLEGVVCAFGLDCCQCAKCNTQPQYRFFRSVTQP